MLNYPIFAAGRRLRVMLTAEHCLERVKFVFTERTGVRLGGLLR